MERPRIAVDAMGGDFAPHQIVEGALQAAQTGLYDIILVGNAEAIQKELKRLGGLHAHLQIETSDSVVEMHESPALACRQKPNSSIMVAAKLVAENRADAMISAGNSGAAMASALMHLKRLPGVSRPAIMTTLPTLHGLCVLSDAGANVDCKPKHLLQFAIMASEYVKKILRREKPSVGLLSIGEEPTKGNELTLASAELFKKYIPGFIGNVEGRDIPRGTADVVICDGFVGNVVLKFGEGLSEALVKLIKEQVKAHPIARIGGLFLRSSLRGVARKTDYAEYGGAPLLGVNGVCIISHGKSNPKAIRNAIRVAGEFVDQHINDDIQHELNRIQVLMDSDEASNTPCIA